MGAVLGSSGSREWRNRQTRTVQVRVPERVWGFNSPLAHQRRYPLVTYRPCRGTIGSQAWSGAKSQAATPPPSLRVA